MITFEYMVVALIVLLSLIYLVKAFWPKSKQGGCACSNVNCKVPKPTLKRQRASPPPHEA